MSRWTVWSKVSTSIVAVVLLLSTMLLIQRFQASSASARNEASVWLTSADLQTHLARQDGAKFSTGNSSGIIRITVDEHTSYQQMDGFGASLTDGSAWLMYHKMSREQRNDLMQRLFDPARGIGLSFLRQPMGASDLTPPSRISLSHTMKRISSPCSNRRCSSTRRSRSWPRRGARRAG